MVYQMKQRPYTLSEWSTPICKGIPMKYSECRGIKRMCHSVNVCERMEERRLRKRAVSSTATDSGNVLYGSLSLLRECSREVMKEGNKNYCYIIC